MKNFKLKPWDPLKSFHFRLDCKVDELFAKKSISIKNLLDQPNYTSKNLRPKIYSSPKMFRFVFAAIDSHAHKNPARTIYH